ncbi:hypothetical protein IPM62_05895 [Candidatus Woesebacteria bacterium]|nr:MAG: hypothetical protein IPM62_05895 [Candidatus Woesebacteria bacterium]
MTHRRTRKQKSLAKHQFTVSWTGNDSSDKSSGAVKGEKKINTTHTSSLIKTNKNAVSLAKAKKLGLIKKDIIKTLFVASLILSLELVIYLVLR